MEIRCNHPNCVRLEARGASGGGVAVRDLVRHTLRHRSRPHRDRRGARRGGGGRPPGAQHRPRRLDDDDPREHVRGRVVADGELRDAGGRRAAVGRDVRERGPGVLDGGAAGPGGRCPGRARSDVRGRLRRRRASVAAAGGVAFASGGGAGHGRAGVAPRRRPARGEGGSSGGDDGGVPPGGAGRLVGGEAVACAAPPGKGQRPPRAGRDTRGPSAAGGWRRKRRPGGRRPGSTREAGGRGRPSRLSVRQPKGGCGLKPAHSPQDGRLVVLVDIEGGRRRRGRRGRR